MPKRSVARSASSPPRATQALADVLLSSQLLESIPDAIVAVQPDGTIVRVNSQTEALFGYRSGELVGKKIEVLVPERFRPQHKSHRASYAESPKIRRMGAASI